MLKRIIMAIIGILFVASLSFSHVLVGADSTSLVPHDHDFIGLHKKIPNQITLSNDSKFLNSRFSLEEMVDLELLIAKIDQDTLENWLTYLSDPDGGNSVRLAGTPTAVTARDWIKSKFIDFGYDSVRIDTFMGQQLWERNMVEAYNIVAIKPGTTYPDRRIVIGAHNDAVPELPGADDDGSGTVALLAIAKALVDVDMEMTVVFASFGDEEGGLWGSRDYAWNAAQTDEDIIFMINLDMIGHHENTNEAALWTGPTFGYAMLWQEVAAQLVGIQGYHLGSAGSDNWPFMWNGYDILFVEELIFSTNYHTLQDSITYINFDYLTRMAKATLATLYISANTPPPPNVLSVQNNLDGHSVSISWSMPETDDLALFIVAYAEDPLALDSTTFVEVPKEYNATTLFGLTEDQTYVFSVISVDSSGNQSYGFDIRYFTPSTSENNSLFTLVEDIWPTKDGTESYTAAFVDINNDDYLDIFASSYGGVYYRANRLYLNDGNGSFTRDFDNNLETERASSYGVSFADFDNDSDLDLFLPNWSIYNPTGNIIYKNNGSGDFNQVDYGITDPVNALSGSWADYDLDGDLDLYVVGYDRNNTTDYTGPNSLYRNDDGVLVQVTSAPVTTDLNYALSSAWFDYNNDMYPDLMVNTTFGKPNKFYKNNGDGSFTALNVTNLTDQTEEWTGCSWGDYDNDGDLDVFITGTYGSLNKLFRNNSYDVFINIIGLTIPVEEGFSYGSGWADFDNDGDLDLFVAVGNPDDPYGTRNALFENNGNGTFTRIVTGDIYWERGHTKGVASGDYDLDGDLDLYVTRFDNLNNNLFRNNGNSNNWINIKCIGEISNKSAIGAKVRLKATISGTPTWQMREIMSQTGYCSQSSLNAHFGLGDATIIDTIKFEWPSGIEQIMENVAVNQFLAVTEQCCLGVRGNTDYDEQDVIDINDLVYLVEFAFNEGPSSPCFEEGNVDGIDVIDIADIVYMVEFQFLEGPLPPDCNVK